MPLLFSSISMAQHEMHGMNTADSVLAMTMPENDEILATAPESMMLHFESDVLLVKLVLRDPRQAKNMIKIDFRYSPTPGVHFVQPLPVLKSADYYTAEWAVLDGGGKLIKGVFYFSFGDNARPASYYLNQMKHPDHIMPSDYRLQ
jgi:methionine-rich copper-binding protein CopC